MKEACGVTTNTGLADALGISQAAVSKARKKGKVPPDWIITISLSTGVDLAWLVKGEGSISPGSERPGGPTRDLLLLRRENAALSSKADALKDQIVDLLREKNDLQGQLYEKAIDPERDFVMRVVGLAECSMSGWYTFGNTTLHTVAPVDVAKSKEGFAAIAIGDSMIPAGIEPGFLVFCDPTIKPREGDAVFVERTDGHASIKLYYGEDDVKGIPVLRLQGWLPQNPDDLSAPQAPVKSEINLDTIARVATVVYVKRRP